MKKIGFMLAATLLAATTAGAAPPVTSTCNVQGDSPITWKNELGSTATLKVDSNGSVSGSYINGAPSSCTTTGQDYPLTGYCNGNAITFTVNWGSRCSSLTSWSGVYYANTQKIATLWYLVTGGAPSWNSTVAGADTFTKK